MMRAAKSSLGNYSIYCTGSVEEKHMSHTSSTTGQIDTPPYVLINIDPATVLTL